MSTSEFQIRLIERDDRGEVASFLREQWGTTKVVSRGKIYWADQLPGFLAMQADRLVGLVTYNMEDEECEIVTLDSTVEGIGVGSALIEAVKDIAASVKCRRLWLITTNDNIDALRFYQKRGLFLAKLHRLALDKSRKLKPEIPLVGNYDIPMRDEIELEMPLWKWIGDEEPRKRGFAARFFHEHRANISQKIDTPGSEAKGETDDKG